MTVGIFQLALGVFRLGLIINFLSHPVVNGFTNAGAIIIATSQLSKLFGVYVDKAPHNYETIIRVIKAAIDYTHWPTLAIGSLAIGIMVGLKRLNPKIPYVLAAVVITTLISWLTGFEHNVRIPVDNMANIQVRNDITDYNAALDRLTESAEKRAGLNQELEALKASHAEKLDLMQVEYEIQRLTFKIAEEKQKAHVLRKKLRHHRFFVSPDEEETGKYYLADEIPRGLDVGSRIWHIKIGQKKIDPRQMLVYGGGDVVGSIPKGLPALSIPKLEMSVFFKLLPFAVIISLLGFMEAIAIAKAMAAKTGQRLDPNQELIGQGLSNIIGSIGKSYAVSGSFSRSAVNLQSGAVTGMSSVITSMAVIITLLFFTPFLYHLPQAVLAAVIMMAVIGLVNVTGFIHAWRAQWYDGAISIISFVATLAFAPHLDKGIYIGVALSLCVFLYKAMRPKVSSLSRHEDQAFRAFEAHGLKKMRVHRFDPF